MIKLFVVAAVAATVAVIYSDEIYEIEDKKTGHYLKSSLIDYPHRLSYLEVHFVRRGEPNPEDKALFLFHTQFSSNPCCNQQKSTRKQKKMQIISSN